MALLFKILSRPEWDAFQQSGRFAGSAVDRKDGFIHFSYAHQLAETARKHFANQPISSCLPCRATLLGCLA